MAKGVEKGVYDQLLTPVALYTGDGRRVNQDLDSGAIASILAPHLMVHEGRSFSSSHVWTAVAAGNSQDLLLRVPDTTREVHLVYGVTADLTASIDFYESATIVAPGTALLRPNANRRNANQSRLQTYYDPTLGMVGILLEAIRIPGGTVFKGAIGGEARRAVEWILRNDTDYLVRITNRHNTDPAILAVQAEWYEVSE